MSEGKSILISTSTFGEHDRSPLDRLEAAGVEVRLNPHRRKLRTEEIGTLLADVDGIIAGTEPLGRETLAAAPRLRVISRCGTGLDNVDLVAARDLNIKVLNTPSAHVDAVAELTLGGILDLLRHVSAADRGMRGRSSAKPMGRLLRGKTVGLIGLGRVGKRLVELLAPFEVRVLAHDPIPDFDFAAANGVEYADLDDVVGNADIVSLHIPYTPEHRHLLNRERLGRMRPTALLVNTARGGLVDEEALHDLLSTGRLAGAFLDTFEREPYQGPLCDLENALLTPHIGSYAAESRVRMESEAVENLLAAMANESP